MGIILVRYKEDRERGKSHSEAKENCIWRMVGIIEAKADIVHLRRQEKLGSKTDHKKIVAEIDALIKEFNSLDNYKDVDVTQIKNRHPAGKRESLFIGERY